MAKKLSALSRPENLRRVKNGDITLTAKAKAELKALKKRSINLNDPDAPEIKAWQHGVRGKFYRPIKQQVTVRLDMDVLNWFKHQPEKYQTLINKVCRDYMLKHSDGKF